MLPQVPAPIIFPRKAPAPRPPILAALKATVIELRGLVYVIDVPVDVFRGLEASPTGGTWFWVCVGFQVSARYRVRIGNVEVRIPSLIPPERWE